jgi:tRNA(Ile)-lysidine synthase
MPGMLDKVREALRKHSMVAPGEKVLVAVSGGADSMALLYALFWLRKEFELELAIAHLDHGIRRDTAEDLKVVRAAANDLGLPLFFERVDTPAYARQEKLNLEEAARRLRRDFLLRTAKETQAKKIALGHTRTDLAETVLLHLIRGAGPSGLKGFLPVALPFIRPLILCSREETRAFCEQHSIPFRDDPTNFDTRYLRNALRLEILPRLREHNPKVEEALARAAQLFAETEEVLEWAEAKALSELRQGKGLDLAKMQVLPKSVQALLVRALAKQFGITLYRRHVEAILRGVESKRAGEYCLPHGLVARVGGGLLVIEERKPPPAGFWTLNFPGETIIPELGWGIAVNKEPRPPSLESPDPYQIYVSPRKIQFPLFVRAATKDDSFLPFGEGKTKRVWEVLAREGIPRWERERWPVVVERNSVVWVVGVRPSGEYSVEEDEKEVISLRAWRI